VSVRPIGVTVAVPAAEFDRPRRDLERMLHDMGEQAQPMLRAFVGGTQPRGALSVKIDGPDDHPILGQIYAFTLAAPFETDDLPADCDAYVAFNGGAGGVIQPDVTPILGGSTDTE
jgi:hypothetical protein